MATNHNPLKTTRVALWKSAWQNVFWIIKLSSLQGFFFSSLQTLKNEQKNSSVSLRRKTFYIIFIPATKAWA